VIEPREVGRQPIKNVMTDFPSTDICRTWASAPIAAYSKLISRWLRRPLSSGWLSDTSLTPASFCRAAFSGSWEKGDVTIQSFEFPLS
jgi:hypothetical protein